MNHSDSTDAEAVITPSPDPFVAMGRCLPTSAPRCVPQDLISAPEHPFTAGSGLNAANDMLSTPASTTLVEAFTDMATQPMDACADVPDAWPMLSQAFKAFFDGSSVDNPLVGNSRWIGMAPEAAATHNHVVSPSNSITRPAYQDELLPLVQGQPVYHAPFSSGSGSEVGLVAPVSGVPTYPVEWATEKAVLANPTATPVPAMTAHKCRFEAEESHSDEVSVGIDTREMPPQNRARGMTSNGIQETKASAAGTCHKSVARIPKTRINNKPMEAGRGAEGLATSIAQGIYCQSLLGPSFQRGWAAEAEDGQLTWVEGSVEEEALHHIGSTVRQRQQRQQQPEEAKGHFSFPKPLKTEHKALLTATQTDWVRGTISEIKCRLCPDTNFNKWENFKRHCDTNETHPSKISFCNDCGDFFARGDSLERHRKNPPPECLRVTPEKAEAKRRETQKTHDEFKARLEECLKTDGDVGMSFSQMIKEKFPDSSKKRTGGSWE